MDMTDPTYNAALGSEVMSQPGSPDVQDMNIGDTGEDTPQSNVQLVDGEILSMVMSRKKAS